MSYLELKNVYKSYKNKHVLNGVNLSVEQGEMVAIMGISGSGKSTLLHILAGIEHMDSGSYIFDHRDLSKMNGKEMARLRNQEIGYILQSYALIGNMTTYENIILPLLMRKIAGNKTYDIVEKLSHRLGLTEILNQKAINLSGGEKQRTAIARALAIKPKIILADEPTGALDGQTTQELMKLLSEINQKGQTMIIVTHSNEVASYADRTLQLSKING